MTGNPLGKYAEGVASIIAVLITVAFLLSVIDARDIPPNEVLNAAFWAILGYIFGARVATNGAAKIALAAHSRLDAINAPPSAQG